MERNKVFGRKVRFGSKAAIKLQMIDVRTSLNSGPSSIRPRADRVRSIADRLRDHRRRNDQHRQQKSARVHLRFVVLQPELCRPRPNSMKCSLHDLRRAAAMSAVRPHRLRSLSTKGGCDIKNTRAFDNRPMSSRSQALFRSITEVEHVLRQHYLQFNQQSRSSSTFIS
jgi:hypothetical protein